MKELFRCDTYWPDHVMTYEDVLLELQDVRQEMCEHEQCGKIDHDTWLNKEGCQNGCCGAVAFRVAFDLIKREIKREQTTGGINK